MRFRIATNNVSGIKEYLIQTLRKTDVIQKELYALNHINFNVYRGEIVGGDRNERFRKINPVKDCIRCT